MIYHSERNMRRESGSYYIGSTPFSLVNVRESYAVEHLRSLGFPGVRSYTCLGDPAMLKTQQDKDAIGYMFLAGVKSK